MREAATLILLWTWWLPLGAQEIHIPLNDGWRFAQVGKGGWFNAEVPGVVQTDLLRNGLIPDYMQGSNIDSVQWVEHADWVYERTIIVSDTLMAHDHLDLVFKGLDTFGEVTLNGTLLGQADNMFRTWEWPVKDVLHVGENQLRVVFRSPISAGAQLRTAYGIQLPHDNDPSGVSPYIRKAAYQFGWDFCPRLVTCGIWKEVELRGWNKGRIKRVAVGQTDLGNAVVLRVKVETNGVVDERHSDCGLVVQVWEPERKQPLEGRQALLGSDAFTIRIDDPKRWEPLGSGEQHLYRVHTALNCGGVERSVHDTHIGIRTVRLDTTRDAHGKAFTFEVNGRGVFMKGCNIVPPDLVPCRDADRKWVDLVRRMGEAGMNMVRVWAGGIYPPDAFFTACDTAGILVWQDFMLGNLPPGNAEFQDNLAREAQEQVERLSGHPSLALFCADNELEVAWRNWGWQDRYGLHGEDSGLVLRAYQEAQHLLATASQGMHIPYTPTSPLSNWGNAKGLTEGDLHYWGVWHGDSTFSSFRNNVGRFVSEYGFQSYPDSTLLAKYNPPESLYLGSTVLSRMQRSYRTDRPIWEAIEREAGQERPTTFGKFIEASQQAQAKAYDLAIQAHLGARPRCMGTLLWQLNDCWPGPSWSIIDYAGYPKPVYEVVKRLYRATTD
ncbi:MAG: hypothetical protein IT225_10600 [Flavobacteriales bacterium]|jgi:beta-mannosidase|nr:hypothetical protein [Flavobacteriales bacterium]